LEAAGQVFQQMPVLPDDSPESVYIRQLGRKLMATIPQQTSWLFPMTERSLRVTHRKGQTVAASCTSPTQPARRARGPWQSPDGPLIVDRAASGRPLGIEFTAPQALT
jgi:hypothetical protein